MIAPLAVCSVPGCPNRVHRGLCYQHARTSTRNHGGVPRQQRGYNRKYELSRATFVGRVCELRYPGCDVVLTPANVSADHYEGGLRPACQPCQRKQGAERARALR